MTFPKRIRVAILFTTLPFFDDILLCRGYLKNHLLRWKTWLSANILDMYPIGEVVFKCFIRSVFFRVDVQARVSPNRESSVTTMEKGLGESL